MEDRKKMPTLSRIISFGAFLLLLCMGCEEYSINPEVMLGHWKSLQRKPDLTIGRDSAEYYAIIHHKLADGKECPVRYPLVTCGNSTYIKANSRILLVFSKVDTTLFLSPGGKYCLSGSK